MKINSVLDLKKCIAAATNLMHDSDDVYVVYRHIKRNLDHPMFGTDWSAFLSTIDFRKIIISK